MWWEKTGAADYGFPGKNFQKKLVMFLPVSRSRGIAPCFSLYIFLLDLENLIFFDL
jgi:hypothetical protein